MTDHSHIPVLAEEVLELLAPAPGEVYADATAGLGGHAALVAARLGPTGTVVLNDADQGNLLRARAHLEEVPRGPRVVTFHGNFAELPRKLAQAGLAVDMLLADLGFASNQMDDAARGFSFMRDGPLDMRLDPTLKICAAQLVNSLPPHELTTMIRDLGEEPAAPRVSRAIVAARASAPITTTARLADVIRSAIPRRGSPIDPATRTFQALRIAVNDELGSLEALLAQIERAARDLAAPHPNPHPAGRPTWLKPGSRIAIITFHSLEDRPAKRALGRLEAGGLATDLSHGVRAASEAETVRNPRARSAKLRAALIAGVTNVRKSV